MSEIYGYRFPLKYKWKGAKVLELVGRVIDHFKNVSLFNVFISTVNTGILFVDEVII